MAHPLQLFMQLPLAVRVVIVAGVAIDLLFLLTLLALRLRGVTVKLRTMFGPALIFDSTDDEGTPIRLLNVGGTFQSICYTGENWDKLACIYHLYFAEVIDLVAEIRANWPARALVIGGGGYSFPKWLAVHYPQSRTTVVEIDPAITRIARDHFYLDRVDLELVTDDGWAYLQSPVSTGAPADAAFAGKIADGATANTMGEKNFDVIVNDAFGGKRPLGPLKTADGARAVHDRLAPGGIYLANVMSSLEGKLAGVLHESIDACKAEFAHVYLIPENPDDPTRGGTNVLIASDERLKIAKQYVIK